MKKFLSLLLAIMMTLSLVSIASAEQGEKVTVGLAGDPGNIGPFQGMSAGRIGILFTTYEMLMAKDATGKFGPVLMKEMTTVDDLTYDVEIWDYIYDQAGNHLTANDIKFCYDSAIATGNLPKLASLRFRKNDKRYPGRPDIVLPKYKTAVFVHGCFWHLHEGCKYAVMPKSNVEYWEKKLYGNRERDEHNRKELEEMGWNVGIALDREENECTVFLHRHDR